MHTLILLLLVVFICIGEVYPRHVLEEVNEPDLLSSEQNDGIRRHTSDQNRHRRRRWQANYGAYEYPLPPYYYPERRDYDRNQQDLLPQIVKLLEEISTYIRRPQPPAVPQPIYIPYPVPYPVPQYTPCSENTTKKPTIHNRFPVMEDTNQNWGFVIDKDDDTDDLSDSRPISFDPIKPIRPMKRPAPNVEHGSSMGNSQPPSTPAPQFNDQSGSGVLRTPINCNAAIVLCCAETKSQQLCFNGYGCGTSYDSGNACSQNSIQNAVESIKSTFAPVQ